MDLHEEIRSVLFWEKKPLSAEVIRWRVARMREASCLEKDQVIVDGYIDCVEKEAQKLQSLATFKRTMRAMPDVETVLINKKYYRQLIRSKNKTVLIVFFYKACGIIGHLKGRLFSYAGSVKRLSARFYGLILSAFR